MNYAKLTLPLALLVAALPVASAGIAAQSDDFAPMKTAAKDPEMEAARAEAQRTLPEFLKLLANPPAGTSRYVIKFPLGGWEHIWVNHLTREGSVLVGELANYPEQDGYEVGQVVRVPIKDISDWSYRDAKGVAQGHFTTRVLLKRMPPAEAREVSAALGWDK